MTFINEYASDADIEKYELNDVWDRYRPAQKKRFWGRKPELTVDHERNVFLMVHSSGAVSGGTQFKFLLSINKQESFVYLNLVKGTSRNLSERPFSMVWDLVLIEKPENSCLEDSEIVRETKAAVSAYGYSGARKQVPGTVVKFNF